MYFQNEATVLNLDFKTVASLLDMYCQAMTKYHYSTESIYEIAEDILYVLPVIHPAFQLHTFETQP